MVSCEYSDWYAASVEGEAENVIRKESLSEYLHELDWQQLHALNSCHPNFGQWNNLHVCYQKTLRDLEPQTMSFWIRICIYRYSRMICIHIKP